jgi:2-iminobutanoate/2-iminopropanoate deaminase
MPQLCRAFVPALLLLCAGVPVFGQKPENRQIIKTEKAPVPTAPYSQGVKANGFLFVAGQVGLNPQTRQLVTGGFEQEATQVMENIRAILEAAGLGFGDVVNTTIYLKDVANFGKVNEIYGRYFTGDYPARTTVGVAALPGNANVEIAVVAVAR